MNIKQGQKLRDIINNNIELGEYDRACSDAKKLMCEAEKKHWTELLIFSLSIQLAFAVEKFDLKQADILVKKLELFPPTVYGMFLQARLLLKKEKRYDALQMGEKALAFANVHKDTTPKEMFEKIYNLLGFLSSLYGNCEKAVEYDWQAVETSGYLDLKATNYSNYLFNLHLVRKTPLDYYKEHIGYNDLFKELKWYRHESKYYLESIQGKPVGKIRIGYISPDFRYHVVLRFCWVMLSSYDKNSFEVYCYHNNPNEDYFSEDIKSMTDNWRNISGMSAKQAAEIIYNDKIDILVDLAGHTKGNPLPILAYKPAPIQISGIGYFATTGLKAVDYFLSDKFLASDPRYFSEDIISLEHSHFCYSPLYEAPATGEAPCMNNGYITFGSFNAIRKINDEVLELWADILKAVPGSHLLLKGEAFNEDYGYKLFCRRLMQFGIDVECDQWHGRIELRGFTPEYLDEYLEMDIALDTFPYPGGGTTCDALYMGIPVITLAGNTHGERFGKSLLENIGLSEFVVYDKQSYFDLAVALASDKETINNLHIGLRNMMEKSPLMNRSLYMKELEGAYSKVWTKYVTTLSVTELPTAKEELNYSFDYYKGEDYEKAEAWCRLVIKHDVEKKYLLESTSLLSDILQSKLDYVGALTESRNALDLLAKESDKGTKEFQKRLWTNYASRSYKLGFLDEAVEAYEEAVKYADDVCEKFHLKGSAILAFLCRCEDGEAVKEKLKEIERLIGRIGDLQRDKLSHVGKGKFKPSPMEKVSTKLTDEVKIHIAYISPDFRQHVMFSFYYTMLHSYNKDKFKVTCISTTEKKDGFTEHLRGLVDNWIDVSEMKRTEIIKNLKKEKIDILVDLAGHSADSSLPVFYSGLAKVQISGLGWMESTGLSCVDYLITDKYIDPDLKNITERALYLTSQFCYTGRNDVPVPNGAPCKEKGYITFGVFNHYCKWTDEMILGWKEIMEQVPNSRLLLKCQLLVSQSACNMVQERLKSLDFDMKRIILEPATNTYMNRYLDVDIALDTYPYTGGGTTCDALYMGVPVVSRYGERRGSRFGLSILSNAGLGELAVSNVHDYVERAIGLANDVDLLDMLHKNLRKMMNASPIMDGKKYMTELEGAYINILAGK